MFFCFPRGPAEVAVNLIAPDGTTTAVATTGPDGGYELRALRLSAAGPGGDYSLEFVPAAGSWSGGGGGRGGMGPGGVRIYPMAGALGQLVPTTAAATPIPPATVAEYAVCGRVVVVADSAEEAAAHGRREVVLAGRGVDGVVARAVVDQSGGGSFCLWALAGQTYDLAVVPSDADAAAGDYLSALSPLSLRPVRFRQLLTRRCRHHVFAGCDRGRPVQPSRGGQWGWGGGCLAGLCPVSRSHGLRIRRVPRWPTLWRRRRRRRHPGCCPGDPATWQAG